MVAKTLFILFLLHMCGQHKRLLIQPCTYHKLECVFHCLLLLFLIIVFHMNMNMNIVVSGSIRTYVRMYVRV